MFKHARWRQARIVSTFFSSKDVLYVLTEDASLWSANVQDSCVTEVLSDKVCHETPFQSLSNSTAKQSTTTRFRAHHN